MKQKRKINIRLLILLLTVIVVFLIFIVCSLNSFDDENGLNDSSSDMINSDYTGLKDTVFNKQNKNGNLFNHKGETVNNVTDGNNWNLILVNPFNFLPDNFEVELSEFGSGHFVDKRICDDLSEMFDAAKEQGLCPIICSSYRTNEKQTQLYTARVQAYIEQGYSENQAQSEAAKWVAIPGTSEHETGLAVDIVSLNYQILDKKQEETDEQKWLMNNSYKYGFILRYPNNKSEITGISYEPWHYRYVGKVVAAEIFESGICFEEYLDDAE